MRRAGVIVAAAFVGCGLAVAAPAQAATPQLAPVMLVLDSSGSMAQTAGTSTKIVAAKLAVRSLLAGTPGNARMGLEIYGAHTGSAAADKARGCRDVSVVHPVGALDRAGLQRAADSAQPHGYTPIGQALKTAAAALPQRGPRSIVLVSDGEDTCAPPDPCAVARQLAKSGVDLRIHTIGFDVDAAARAQLVCIAQSTGGSYADAPDAGSLGPVLRRTTGQALRNYQPAGVPVTGSTDKDDAPQLKQGTYLDTLGTGSRQYYAVDVPDRTTVYFSATAVYSRVRSPNQTLHLRLKGPDGSDCGTADNDAGSSRAGDSSPLTAAISWLPGSPGQASGCGDSGVYVFQVYRNSNGSDRVPLEISVDLEGQVSSPGPAPAAGPVAARPPRGGTSAVTGGGSFGQAATLGRTGRYIDHLQHGEYVFYRVKLDWGQGLAATVRYGTGDSDVAGVEASLYAPYRKRLGAEAASYLGRSLALPALATYPVRYRDRSVGAAAERAESQAGYYYVAVKLGRGARSGVGGGTPVRVEMDLTVAGSAEGGPTYAAGTTPSAAPSSTASATVSRSPATAAAKQDPGGRSALWWVLGIVLVVLVCGTGVAMILRSSRS